MMRCLRRSCAGLLGALVLAGCVSTPAPRVPLDNLPPSQVDRATRNLRVFNSVWTLVFDKHFDPKLAGIDWRGAAATFGPKAAATPDKKSLYAVLNEMLEPLHDSHTHALTPEQADERQRRIRARTGFSVARMEGKWVVTGVVPGSPAEEGGVRPGWIVAARNDRPFGERFDVKAQGGETAKWEFIDANDQRQTLSLTARELSTRLQQSRVLENGILYLRFDEFDFTDLHWLSAQLKEHRDAPACIVDLRLNPGGETISLGMAVGEFFDHSVDCGSFISRSGSRAAKSSWLVNSARYSGRVVVLTDAGTASAAEIFSATLREHGRATLVGRKTAGAVLASWFYVLPDGGELQISREDYLTSTGRRIEGNGLEPDLKVARTLGDLRAGRDPDIDAALRVLQAPPAPST